MKLTKSQMSKFQKANVITANTTAEKRLWTMWALAWNVKNNAGAHFTRAAWTATAKKNLKNLLTFNTPSAIIIIVRRLKQMTSRNDKKKMTYEDKFARNFYCQHARLNSIRRDKKQCTRKFRKINKNLCKKSIDIWYHICYNN